MNRLILLFVLLLSAMPFIYPQKLKGTIVNTEGKPIPNSTVYFLEIASGIAADDEGQFQTTLPQGFYTAEFRSLGYENERKTVQMGTGDQSIRIVLKEKIYALSEVVVTNKKEDPAYRIMRKAIAHAPYYRYQVKRYSCEAYIKGSLVIDKIPGIIKNAIKLNEKDVKIDDFIGKPLVMESYSDIDFISPETFKQNVKALKTSIPKQFDRTKGLSMATSSIYNQRMNGKLSPLSSGAFSYYAFKLEDVDYQQDRIINKIKIIPRKKNPELFSGYLYILEDSWNVYAADLIISALGTSMHYRINYHQVKPSVYLPTTYDASMTMNTMGVKGSGRYYTSVKYKSVEIDETHKPLINESMAENVTPDTKVSPSQQKILSEIDKLTQKDELSTKEAYKIAKLMNKISEPEETKQRRESLEIKDIEDVKMELDSMALKRDTAYWSQIRDLPLKEEEKLSYRKKDSISVNDTSEVDFNDNEIVLSVDDNPKTPLGRLLQGGRWKISDKASLRYGGLMGVFREYNFVDGFWLGQTLSLTYKPDKKISLVISPSIYHATARKQTLWHTSGELHYAPMSMGRLLVSGGHISRDVNGSYGVSRLMNTIAAIDLGQNFIRFYDSKYFRIANHIDIANGFRIHTELEINNRSSLANATSFNFLKKEVPENIPSANSTYPTHTASTLNLGFSYTPRYRYRIYKGAKYYDSSKYPTFNLQYTKVLRLLKEINVPEYDRLAFSVSQRIKVSLYENFNYMFSTGTYLSSKKIYLNDLKYFGNSPMLFTDQDFENAFNLLDPYTATDKWWLEGHMNYQSNYLLFKNLPFLQRFAFDEAVHLSSLLMENKRFYLEGGYSIGFLGLGRVGVFAGFNGQKFDRVGVRISYPLFQMIEKPFK